MAEQKTRLTLPPLAATQKSSGAATRESDKAQNADNGALASGEPKKEPVPGKDFPAHLFPYPEGSADVSLERFFNVPQLQKAVATYVKDASAAAIKQKGAFTVVLSGGSLVKVSQLRLFYWVGDRGGEFWLAQIPWQKYDKNSAREFGGLCRGHLLVTIRRQVQYSRRFEFWD